MEVVVDFRLKSKGLCWCWCLKADVCRLSVWMCKRRCSGTDDAEETSSVERSWEFVQRKRFVFGTENWWWKCKGWSGLGWKRRKNRWNRWGQFWRLLKVLWNVLIIVIRSSSVSTAHTSSLSDHRVSFCVLVQSAFSAMRTAVSQSIFCLFIIFPSAWAEPFSI